MAPNFLIFIVDQLCASHLGSYGSKVGATPHIDALAARGWRATDCHVATPICMPNRASLLTGRMPSAHGVRHNGIALSLGARTCVDVFREGGYDTALIGKSHLQNMTGKAPLPVAGRNVFAQDAEPRHPGNYLQESVATWRGDPKFDVQTPFYGFGHVALAIEHGDEAEGHYRRWLRAQHPGAEALCGPSNALPADDYVLTRHHQAWRTRLPEELHPTAWIADRTIAQLDAARASGKPFFTYCSFPDPHHPYTPPGRYWDRYRPEDMELPPSFTSAHAAPPHLQWLRDEREAGRAVKHTMACFAATEREVREALALGYGSLAFIDAQIGRVLAALDAMDLARDTVVVFTSDHGEYAGDHQLLFKGSLHYPSVTRTPLIWCEPGGVALAQASGDALLSTIDIAPTLLARAGLERFNGMQGHSFLPQVRGEGDGIGSGEALRNALLIEEEGQRTYFGFDAPVRMRSLLTAQHRMSVYEGVAWGELYDRQADSQQARNLWDDPASAGVRAGLMEQLARTMLAHTTSSPTPTAVA
jgi:arylsulfatase A-like enzyme